MTDAVSNYDLWSPRLLSILRVVTAFVFMEHGTQKLLGLPPSPQPMPSHLPPLLMVAGILEAFGGLLILFGLLTRPVALILAGEMAVAYFMVHARHSFWPLVNRGESAVLYCFIFLFLAAAGGGAWSIDRLWRRV
ncbi:MAG TPA: DoxX family protein [Terriglobia bacterium]|jgi:putative oxidoreductase|nr:DoxX family protein [Terriglobia bacterium]